MKHWSQGYAKTDCCNGGVDRGRNGFIADLSFTYRALADLWLFYKQCTQPDQLAVLQAARAGSFKALSGNTPLSCSGNCSKAGASVLFTSAGRLVGYRWIAWCCVGDAGICGLPSELVINLVESAAASTTFPGALSAVCLLAG